MFSFGQGQQQHQKQSDYQVAPTAEEDNETSSITHGIKEPVVYDFERSGGSNRITPRHKPRASSLLSGGDEPVLVGNSSNDPRIASIFGGLKQHASDFNLQALATSVHSMQQRTALHVQTRFPLLGAPFWACFFYSLVSTSMILVNKLLLTTYEFKYPMVLLFHQNLMTVNSLYLAKELGITTYEPLETSKVLRWLPMDVFFVIMLLTGFYSVQLLSVPMVTIFKNTNNIFIAIGDAIVFGNIPSQGVIYTMLLMLLAAVMAALNDLEFTVRGYAWTFANCLASTMFVLYAQSAIAKTNLSTFGKVYYNNVLALPLVLICDFFVFGDFQRLFFETESEEISKFLNFEFLVLWFVSGVLGFLQSLSSLRAQHLTSPTTYSMVGSLNKIPLTFVGIWIFHSPMTAKGLLYVSLSIIAGALYSYSKAKEDIAARAAAAQNSSAAGIANSNNISKDVLSQGVKDSSVDLQQRGHETEEEDGSLLLSAAKAGSSSVDYEEGGGAHLRHHKKKSRSMPTPMVDAEQVVGGMNASGGVVMGVGK